MKAYFPIEHAVAVTNNFGGFYKSEFYLHEARIHGATLHPPCVNQSEWLVSLKGIDVFIGFVFIKELQRGVVNNILLERYKNGDFKDLKDFTQRVEISTIQLDLLIRIGAFRFTQKTKCALMWEKGAFFNKSTKNGSKNTSVKHLSLFADETEDFEIPQLEEDEFDQAYDEIELLGFPLCSPFKLLRDKSVMTKTILTKDLKKHIGRHVKMLGYYVCRKRVRTVKGDMMAFGTWIDNEGKYFDTTHFAQSLEQFPLRGKGIYLIEGRVTQEFDFPSGGDSYFSAAVSSGRPLIKSEKFKLCLKNIFQNKNDGGNGTEKRLQKMAGIFAARELAIGADYFEYFVSRAIQFG